MTTTRTFPVAHEARPTHLDDLKELPRALWPHSKRAVLKLALMTPLTRHRVAASPEQMAIAHIVASAHEDCNVCLRIARHFGTEAGLDETLIRAAIRHDVEALPDDLRLVHRLAAEVVNRSSEATLTAREVADRLGEAALSDLALGIAVARFFPTAKRALGIAVSCSVDLEPARANEPV